MQPDISRRTGLGASEPLWPRVLLSGLAVAACYANSLRVPFLLDDPQPGTRLDYSTRPLVAASFALNRALSGAETWSFHLFNALVHLACGLLLLAILRRTMALVAPDLAARTRAGLALVTSLLWLCHPLQTATITYLSQRAEALGAFFYLAVLYAFLRSASAARPLGWQALTLVALALGFVTKETIATAPFVLLLYDSLFLAPGARAALRARRGFYGALALAALVLSVLFVAPSLLGSRTAGLGLEEVGALEYARTQPGVLLHYLRLASWPHPLCFDYGWPVARAAAEYVPQTALIATLALATLVLVLRRSWIGFAAAWFFVLLAPTSSFVPIRDPAFEHRVYLPLAGVLVLAVVGVWWLGARVLSSGPNAARRLMPFVAGAVIVAFACSTIRRNHDYRSAVELMQTTVACAPDNARAHANLGAMLLEAGRTDEAVDELMVSLKLDASAGMTYQNLGAAYLRLQQVERAIPFFRRAVELVEDARCSDSLGVALTLKGDFAEAAACFQRALELDPYDARIHQRAASALRRLGRREEALHHLREALRLDPEHPQARVETAALLAELGRPAEGLENVEASGPAGRESEPPELLGQAQFQQGDFAGALVSFEAAVARHPEDAGGHVRLAATLAALGRKEEALEHYREAVRLEPARQDAHINAAALLAEMERPAEALEHSRQALAIPPNSAEEQFNLAQALRALGRHDEAMAAFLEASRMAPELAEPYAAYAKTVCMKPDASAEERREAQRLADRANDMTHAARPDFLEIGAMAHAAVGEFERAVALVDQALELPGPRNNPVFASRLRAQREDYRSKAGE